MPHPIKLSLLSGFLLLALASCGAGTATAPAPGSSTVTADDMPDDVFSDDDAGEVTAERTLALSSTRAQSLGLAPLSRSDGPGVPPPGSDPGPVSVTAQILRATTGKYAGQVKSKLTLNYSGSVAYKGDFTLKLATRPDAGGTTYLISKRKNDSKDSPYLILKPTKGKPATVKNLTMQYGPALNGAACLYLAYDLKDNNGAGPAEIAYQDPAPLVCEPDGSSQASVQVALLGASAGYLYGPQPWQFALLSGPAAPAATLSELPASLQGAPRQDFEAFFAPLMALPPLSATPTAEEKAAAAKAKQAKKLHDAYLKLFRPTQLGVYVTATETQVVGVNSWGMVGLKSVN